MHPGILPHRLKSLLLPTALAVAAVAIAAAATLNDSVKVAVATAAGALLLLLTYLSGNPRLFCIWGLMISIPFDLSKRLGGIIAKMGGENSVRIEISDPFLFALLLYFVRDIWAGTRQGLRLPRVGWLWIAVIGLGAMAVILGPYRTSAVHEMIRMLKVGLLFVVICNELNSPRRIGHAAAALTLGVLIQSGVGLLQYFTRGHLGLDILGETGAGTLDQLAADSVRTEKSFRAGGFLNHPNIFGAYLACLLPVALCGYLVYRPRLFRAFFAVAIVAGTAALITTLSRSGWLSFFVASLVIAALMMRHPRLRKQLVFPAVGASVLLLVVLLTFAGPIATRLFESKPDAVLGRAEYSRTAWGMIGAKPMLGWGLNSYVFVAPPFTRYGARGTREVYQNWLPPVHNIYLLWWSETGLVGLSLHLAMIAWILRVAMRNLKVADDVLFAINIACIAGIVALLVDGFFSFTLRINSVLRVFWVLAGIIFAIHYWRFRNSRASQAP